MDKTLELLKRLIPDFVAQPVTERTLGMSSTKIDLPRAAEADYFFRLYTAPEMQIHAELTAPRSNVNYFWYRPFESAEFRDSTEALEAVFCETLEKLLTHESRIIQKNGWLNWHFKCDYRSADGWKRIYRHSALKLGGWKVPQIDGRVRTWRSSALAPEVCKVR
jgi:hypothetical protein